MRDDLSESALAPELAALDRALVQSHVVPVDLDGEGRADREQWDALRQRMGLSQGENGAPGVRDTSCISPQSVGVSRRQPQSRRVFLGFGTSRHIAAGIGAALLLCVGALLYSTSRLSLSRPTPATVRQYRTLPGQQSTVRLADGSTMILAPATTATISTTTIDVSGEAYFDVTARASRALTIRTTNAVVQILGTRFMVRHYPDDQASRVIVEDGKIALQSTHGHAPTQRRTVLTAHTMAQIADSGISVRQGIAISEYTAWLHGRRVFNEVPLRDVLTELERAYGVQIRVADSTLARLPMTLAMSVRDDSLTYLLRQIAFTINAHVTRDGVAYVLAPGRASDRVPVIKRSHQQEPQYGR